MWTRIYLLLVLVRLYFALSPSYIHPDENFQGPEVIAGEVFSYPNHLTWEFSSKAIRSVFPLWPAYGLPMEILRWLYMGLWGDSPVSPRVVYYTLRLLMFMASFILEDWAIYELVPNPRQRRVAVILVASSYVTWTYQTHTFSNSVETIVVLWCLVLMQRIMDKPERSSILSSAFLGVFLVFGTFNRITFPAFLVFPFLYLIPHFQRKPLALLSLLIFGATTLLAAIVTDTEFYVRPRKLSNILLRPILTPFNSLIYNTSTSNLAEHGLHPRWNHFLVNFPLLLAPALPLLILRPPKFLSNARFISAITATAILSCIPHQEPRFLIPVVPLLLSCIHFPTPSLSPRMARIWAVIWIVFNLLLGTIYGRYHQAGVVPMQMWLGENRDELGLTGSADILWWKTYSPPVWLANTPRDLLNTTDLMGISGTIVEQKLRLELNCPRGTKERVAFLVVPRARDELAIWKGEAPERENLKRIRDVEWTLLHTVRRHVGLDDLDFGDDGILGTLSKVIGRRGLDAWRIRRQCR